MTNVPLTYMFDLGSISEAMRPYVMHCFAESGAKHLVLCHWLMAEILKDGNLVSKVRKEMEAEGLTFVDAHALFGTFYDLRTMDETRLKHVILLDKLQIAIAAEMGVDTITMHVGADTWTPEVSLERQNANILRALEAILPEAEACGVTVCIENSWTRLGHPDNLLKIKSCFPTEALGLCYDSGHANVLSSKAKQYEECAARDRWTVPFGLEPEWEDCALEKMQPHIVNCHLHDNDAQRDLHNLPGKGNIDWAHILRGLRQAPRLKCVQCEVKTVPNKVTIPTLCRTFEELLKGITA
ncbi:MAG: sugar phosphate isomerase/epimerase [Victivallales bacterium]|nr:sugar phosphate isomerase/epimerase [Victivallales bacterium]